MDKTRRKADHQLSFEELEAGDHIYIRSSPFHSHHGILLEKGNREEESLVIDFNTEDGSKSKSNSTIRQTSLYEFSHRGKSQVRRVQYNDPEHSWKRSGTSYPAKSFPKEEIIRRAKYLHDEKSSFGKGTYNLLFNNCESLARCCTSGTKESAQAANYAQKLIRFVSYQLPSLLRLLGTHNEKEIVQTAANLDWHALTSRAIHEGVDVQLGVSNVIACAIAVLMELVWGLWEYERIVITWDELKVKMFRSFFRALCWAVCATLLEACMGPIIARLLIGTLGPILTRLEHHIFPDPPVEKGFWRHENSFDVSPFVNSFLKEFQAIVCL